MVNSKKNENVNLFSFVSNSHIAFQFFKAFSAFYLRLLFVQTVDFQSLATQILVCILLR